MTRKRLQDVDPDSFAERLNSESDRACGVLGAALLDAKLEAIFRKRLRAFQNELLGNMKPIGAFGARIQMARALDWISDDVCADLDTIRAIRNDFAHSFDHDLAFTDQSVSDRCSNLKTAQAYVDGFDIAASAPRRKLSSESLHAMQSAFKPPRRRFQLAVNFLAQYLDGIPADETVDPQVAFLDEVRSLSARIRFEFKGTATVKSPSES